MTKKMNTSVYAAWAVAQRRKVAQAPAGESVPTTDSPAELVTAEDTSTATESAAEKQPAEPAAAEPAKKPTRKRTKKA